MRLALPLVLPCLLAAPAWALEKTDVRLQFEILEHDYTLMMDDASVDSEFEHAIAVRATMVQPLSVLMTGDLISVIGVAYVDAKDDRNTTTDTGFTYQSFTFRYGFGYRGELGSAFSIDAYPYVGLGWASMEFSGFVNDPGLMMEVGAEIDAAFTFTDWQLGLSASYGLRTSSHTILEQDVEVEQIAAAFGGFVGYRF